MFAKIASMSRRCGYSVEANRSTTASDPEEGSQRGLRAADAQSGAKQSGSSVCRVSSLAHLLFGCVLGLTSSFKRSSEIRR